MADRAYLISDASANDTGSVFRNDKKEQIGISLVTGGNYNGTTATATLQESYDDGANWVNIVDADGNAVTVTMTTATASVFTLKTGIWYADRLRVNYSAGDASTGTVSIYSTVKD